MAELAIEQQNNAAMMRRLRGLLDDDVPTKQDFVELVETIVAFIEKIDKRLSDDFSSLSGQVKQLAEEIKGNSEVSLNDMKGRLNELFVGERISGIENALKSAVREELDIQRSNIESRMSSVKSGDPGRPGKDANEGLITANVVASLRPIFEAEIKKLVNEGISKIKPIKSGGSRKVPIIRAVNLTSQVDGSATTFNLPRDTVRVLAVWSTQFPVVFDGSTDFSLSGQTLTINTPVIQSGQTLHCLIETLFYA